MMANAQQQQVKERKLITKEDLASLNPYRGQAPRRAYSTAERANIQKLQSNNLSTCWFNILMQFSKQISLNFPRLS